MHRLSINAGVLLSLALCASGEQHTKGTFHSLATENTASAPTALLKKSSGFLAKRQPQDDITDVKELMLFTTGETIVSFTVWLAFYVMAAVYYHHNVRHFEPPDMKKVNEESFANYDDFKKWTTGLFECQQHPGICFWSCCCPGIRWSDTASRVGIHPFWPAFICTTALHILGLLPVATTFVFLIVVGYATYHRQEIRNTFGFHEQGEYVKDCCSYFWCFWCTIAQDARQSRDAMIAGHPAIEAVHQSQLITGDD